MAIFVALDAGGTKTQCWIADDTRVLATASCGTVKHMSVAEDVATRRLHALLQTAAADAGVDLANVERTCMGLAGISIESVRRWGEQTLRAVVGGDVLLCGDEEIALEAAFRGKAGILLIAGTGANVVGRCSDGTRLSAGGWGPVIGDEGSGNWIGVEAIRAAFHAFDRSEETALLREAQAFWGLHSLGELIEKANQRARPNFAELAMVVAACAESGDAVAARVLERAGQELAAQVLLVVKKMRAAGCKPKDVSLVTFTGSVVEKIALVRHAMRERLLLSEPEIDVETKAVVPLEGALWKARSADSRG